MAALLFSVTALFHLAIPLGTGGWLALRPARSRASRALALIALLGYTAFLLLAGAGWGMLGQPARLLVAVGVIVLASVAALRSRKAPNLPHGAFGWVAAVVAAVLAVLTIAPLPSTAAARSDLDQAVSLQTPLEAGRYVVIHGGDGAVVNHHALVPAQRHGLDILALDGLGFRASGALPRDLGAYHIFGRRVLAPCEGTVLAARDDLEDLPPPQSDPEHPAGNFVLVHCAAQNLTVVLAHLQHESVTVEPGCSLAPGQPVGRVGNTGNTSEPHLHVHAVNGRVGEIETAIRTAEPVAVRFDGRTLVRNDIFESDLAAD